MKVTFWLVVAVSKTGTPLVKWSRHKHWVEQWVGALERDGYTVLPPEKIEREVK